MLRGPVKLNTSRNKAGLSNRTFHSEMHCDFISKWKNTGWNEVTALEVQRFILGIT